MCTFGKEGGAGEMREEFKKIYKLITDLELKGELGVLKQFTLRILFANFVKEFELYEELA